jgi:hypothetical protein
MAPACPICGEEVEHIRRERPQDPSAHPDAIPGPQTTIEVEKLCSAADDQQWDRICHKAAVERSSGMMEPVLEVFYHYFGDAEALEDDSE